MKKKKLRRELERYTLKAERREKEAKEYFNALRDLWDSPYAGTTNRSTIKKYIPNFQTRIMFVIADELIQEWYTPQLSQQMRRDAWENLQNLEKSTNSDGESRAVFNVRTKDRPGCESTS